MNNKLVLNLNDHDLKLGSAIQILVYRFYNIYSKKNTIIDVKLLKKWHKTLFSDIEIYYKTSYTIEKRILILTVNQFDTSFNLIVDLDKDINECVSYVDTNERADDINIFSICYEQELEKEIC